VFSSELHEVVGCTNVSADDAYEATGLSLLTPSSLVLGDAGQCTLLVAD